MCACVFIIFLFVCVLICATLLLVSDLGWFDFVGHDRRAAGENTTSTDHRESAREH